MEIFKQMGKMENKVYMTKTWGLVFILVLFVMTGEPAYGEDRPSFSVGFRTGFSMSGGMDESFNLYEAIGSFKLPWSYLWDSGWLLTTDVDMTVGKLRGAQDNGFIASLGPAAAFTIPQGWMAFVAGFRVAYLDDYQYGGENFGGRLSFVSELGVEFRIYSGLKAGYRIRHMSNAGIYDNNPGLDMHVLELRYRF